MKKTLMALAAASAVGPAFAQTKWDLPSGYGVNTFQVQNLQWFADEVDKASGGKLKITLHPGASLFKANEIKRAVQGGQTQIGEFILSGSANENALFGVDSIPFLATTYAEAKKLDAASTPVLDKLLASQGMKLLYTVPWPGQSQYTKKPLASLSAEPQAIDLCAGQSVPVGAEWDGHIREFEEAGDLAFRMEALLTSRTKAFST